MITPFDEQQQNKNETCDHQNCTTISYNSTKNTLDWDERTRALVLGMFNYGYCLTQVIGGRLSEKFGTKVIYGISVVGPAVFSFLIPVTAKSSYWGVIVFRFLQGLIQGFAWPAMNVLLAQWFPPHERSRYVGIVALGATFGMIIILPFSGILCDYFSWEVACYVTGAFPLIWGLFWFNLMYSKPNQHPRISLKEKEYIEGAIKEGGTRDIKSKKIPWKSIATSWPFIGTVLCDFGNSFGLTIYSSQMPNYLANVFMYSMTKTGVIAGLPFLFRYCGSCLFSSLADFFISRKIFSIGTTRRIFSAIAMFGPSLVMLLVIFLSPKNMYVFIILICSALFLNGGIAASQLVNCVDIGPNYAGTLFGISNTFSSASSFICILITGEILNDEAPTQEQWKYVFGLSIPVMIATEIFYLIVLSGEPQPWNFYESEEEIKEENPQGEKSKNQKKEVIRIDALNKEENE